MKHLFLLTKQEAQLICLFRRQRPRTRLQLMEAAKALLHIDNHADYAKEKARR